MRRPSRPGLPLLLAIFAGIPLAAQDLQSIGREKPFSCSGSFSLNQILYSGRRADARRDPYRFIATANANLSVYGWTVPLTFTASNHSTVFTQPFNQYALHPTWKWINAHAGYTSMSFSPYTVNGHSFLGGAVELAPADKWRFSALYGRFLKAVQYDTVESAGGLPAYQRHGYGFKATYGTGSDFMNLIFFHAVDDEASIHAVPDSIGVTPQENVVVSVAAGKTVLKRFIVKAELATSALTRDTRAEATSNDHPLARSGIFTPRMSSAYYQAFKTSFDYQQLAWLLGVAYERIDPGYRTLGAWYFNSDLENVTVNGSAGLLQGKLNIAVRAGVQRDNLDAEKVSTMRRVVSAVNINYMPSPKLNLSASYSGFQSFTNIRSQFENLNQLTPYENPDTLNFTQLSRDASLSGMYTLRHTGDSRQQLSVQFTVQDAAQAQGNAAETAGTRFYNLTTAYAVNFVPRNMHAALAFNGTINDGPFIQTRTIGPTVSLTRSFLQRRFRTTLSSSYNQAYSNGTRRNTIVNFRWSSAFALRSKHSLQINTVVVKRSGMPKAASNSITELTATVGYRYVFSVRERDAKN